MSQFYVFLVCVLAGAAGGAGYDLFSLVRAPSFMRRLRWARHVCDALFCLLFAVCFTALSAAMGLPPLRIYMCLGFLAGFALYAKSFHKIVAFFAGKVYNTYKKTRKERKSCPNGKRAFQQKK